MSHCSKQHLWYYWGNRSVPLGIPGLAAGYDFSDLSSLTLDGGNNISQASDKSGNGVHVSQSNVLLRPVSVPNAQNGLSVARLTASGVLRLTSAATYSAQTFFGPNRNACTHVAVVKYTAGQIWARVLVDGNNRVDHQRSEAMTTVRSGEAWNPTPSGVSTAWRVLVRRLDAGNLRFDSWVNSTKFADNISMTGTAWGVSGSYYVSLGNDASAADADIGDFWIWPRALLDGEITDLINHFRTKWAL